MLFRSGLNRALREAGWYKSNNLTEPDLLSLLDLVALGTVCDVVPLAGLNRALVAQGLKVMARRANAGLTALCDVARVEARPDTFHAGFLLGPRVNAGGRVGEAGLGARLLSSDDPAEAKQIALQLDAYNEERRAIEVAVLDRALAQVEDAGQDKRGLVVAAGEGWHPGVIGIVAGRLKERWGRPALVIALDKGIGKGSARSIPGVDIGAAVIAARQSGLLMSGGGHAMAAGGFKGHKAAIGDMGAAPAIVGAQIIGAGNMLAKNRNKGLMDGRQPVGQSVIAGHVAGQGIGLARANDRL